MIVLTFSYWVVSTICRYLVFDVLLYGRVRKKRLSFQEQPQGYIRVAFIVEITQ